MKKRYQILRQKYSLLDGSYVRELAHSGRFQSAMAAFFGMFAGSGSYLAISHSLLLVIVLGIAAVFFAFIAISEGIDAAYLDQIADWNDLAIPPSADHGPISPLPQTSRHD